MIWVLKVISLILYIIFIILIIVYLSISSRTRICLRNKVNNPLCFNDWKCDGQTKTASQLLTDSLKQKQECTLNAFQSDINKACQGKTGNEYDSCVSCLVYSRIELYDCKPQWKAFQTDLTSNYQESLTTMASAISEPTICNTIQKEYCDLAQGYTWSGSGDNCRKI